MNQFWSDFEKRIMTPEAVAFLVDLENEFGWRRGRILSERVERQVGFDEGQWPTLLDETDSIRRGDWKVASPVADLFDRRVEITGPVEARMMINALNSGAKVFMADFEDATTPTWENLLQGQANLIDAHRRTLTASTETKTYRLGDQLATIMVRPRGWHMVERHFLVEGRPMSASLFDFGLYMFHGGRAALEAGSGPYFYLPKLESHTEAALWNQVFEWSQDRLGIDRGTIRATVLIETITAAFEMEEILFELKDHSAGLNAGRWDYIFSVIKKFRNQPNLVLPDRSQITMTVPFMEAYTKRLVATCHRRGAHAIGGMSAFIPSRRDPEVNQRAIAAVRSDKLREAESGCDGTWVAHPDLVPVALEVFDTILGDEPNQIDHASGDFSNGPEALVDFRVDGDVTFSGVKANVEVGLRYLASWLKGTGAVAIDNLMEDVATAEIARSQIWQWVRRGVITSDGVPVNPSLIRRLVAESADQIAAQTGASIDEARSVFEKVALDEDFVEFLTLPAYELIN